MNRLFAALILVCAAWFGLRWVSQETTVEPPDSLAQPAEEALVPIPNGDEELLNAAALETQERESLASPSEVEAPTPDSDSICSVVGQLLGLDGEPLSGQTVEWVYRPEGWEAVEGRTDEQGRFALSFSRYPGARILLWVQPSDQAIRTSIQLGGGQRPALRPGVNDVGVVRCAQGWTVRGKVLGVGGAGVENAFVQVTDHAHIWSVRSEPDGSWQLAGVPEGPCTLSVKSQGYQTPPKVSLDLGPGWAGAPIEFRLEAIEPITGWVFDEQKRPVEGALVRMQSIDRRAMWEASTSKTNAQGAFQVSVHTAGEHMAEVLHPEYRALKTKMEDRTYPAGTRDLEFLLQRADRQAFQVLDRETGKPIEHYSLHVIRRGAFRGPEPASKHPGGISHHEVTPGKSELKVTAEGYCTDRRTAAPQASELEVIELWPEWSVRGRVLWKGEPVAGADVVMQAAERNAPPPSTAEGSAKGQETPDQRRLREIMERHKIQTQSSWRQEKLWKLLEYDLHNAQTDANGEFVIDGLNDHSFRLVASLWGQAQQTIEVRRGTTHVGQIELAKTGSVRGKLWLPPSFPYHLVRLRFGPELRVQVDPDGEFFLPHLAPGSYGVHISHVPDLFLGFEKAGLSNPVVTVVAGEETRAEIDLRQAVVGALSKLHLTLHIGGEPARGFRLMWGAVGSDLRRSLGSTDEQGVLDVVAPQEPFELWGPQEKLPGVGELDLGRSGSQRVTVDLPAGILWMTLPEGFAFPESGLVMIMGRNGPLTYSSQVFQWRIQGGLLVDEHSTLRDHGIRYEPEGRRFVVPGVRPGVHTLDFRILPPRGGDEGDAALEKAYSAQERKVTIQDRQTAVLQLP